MYKFNPSDEWYQKALENEDNSIDISAGPITFNFEEVPSNLNNEDLSLKYSFSVLFKKLRILNGLSISELSNKIDVEASELFLVESKADYRPSFRTINQIAQFFELPYPILAQIAGAITLKDNKLKADLIRYAANSDKFEKLTKEEKKQLNDIIKLIREKANN